MRFMLLPWCRGRAVRTCGPGERFDARGFLRRGRGRAAFHAGLNPLHSYGSGFLGSTPAMRHAFLHIMPVGGTVGTPLPAGRRYQPGAALLRIFPRGRKRKAASQMHAKSAAASILRSERSRQTGISVSAIPMVCRGPLSFSRFLSPVSGMAKQAASDGPFWQAKGLLSPGNSPFAYGLVRASRRAPFIPPPPYRLSCPVPRSWPPQQRARPSESRAPRLRQRKPPAVWSCCFRPQPAVPARRL